MYTAIDFWRLKARLGPRKALGGLDYHRSVEFPYAVNHLQVRAGQSVLDVGSAHLVFGLFLCAVCGARVWVTDQDVTLTQQRSYPARLGHPEWLENGRFNVEYQDATRLPYADDSFDGISVISTIEHIPDEAPAVAELTRVLRPGGRLVLTVPFTRRLRCEYVQGEIYGRPIQGERQFYQRVYDMAAVRQRLIDPSGLAVEDVTVFSELGFPMSRFAYHSRFGRALVGFRVLYPAIASGFMRPTRPEALGSESICAMTLVKREARS